MITQAQGASLGSESQTAAQFLEEASAGHGKHTPTRERGQMNTTLEMKRV